jgi:4-coumarate--CoA ligase
VIGIPDSYAGEVPKAFVVLKAGIEASPATALELQKFVQGKKTRSKWISGGIEFLDAIPKSASGKILRRLLRDRERMSKSAEKVVAKL